MTKGSDRKPDLIVLDNTPASRAAPLVDSFRRRISYLRLSVTDRCDLRCTYCMPERMTFLPKKEVLTLEELYELATGFIDRGVTKIRITGGEPLVRRDIMDLFAALGRRLGHGLEELTLTTNATQLAGNADGLVRAGVRRVNISLDTLDRDRFARLTRRDALPQVMEGIAAAKAAGLKVKLNAVALKGVNEDELPDLIAWAHGEGHDVTLIEVMPLGDVEEERLDQYLPLSDVRERLEQHWTLRDSEASTGGPARYVDIAETGGRLGFITPHTNNFCAGCNRLRVTATGQLYPCLGGSERVDLRAALRSDEPQAELANALERAMMIKPEKHHFRMDRRGADPHLARHMSMTGGLMAGVRIVLLGKLADLAGAPEIALPAPLDWAGLLAALPEGLAEAAQDPRNRIAVNGALVADKASLAAAAGDEIALLPPVSGG